MTGEIDAEMEPGGRAACVFGASGGIGAALVQALAERPEVGVVYAGARRGVTAIGKVRAFRFDLEDEPSIAAAVEGMRSAPPELVIVATGSLAFADGAGPERSVRALDADRMTQLFRVNTIGPALIAKHILPLLPRERQSVFAVLSARVGSIADNRLGGWHSYRASKAALNMLVVTMAVELRRTHPCAIAVALHPGTVDTALSRPFQRNLPPGQLTQTGMAAANLLDVVDRLTPADSGSFFAWNGAPIPF